MGSQALKNVIEAISGQVQGFITEEGTKQFNDIRLQKQFEEIGEFVTRYVRQDAQDEFAQRLIEMFSKEEMDQLYIKISEVPGFVWKEWLNKQLQELCNVYGITSRDAKKFIDNFHEMVFYSLSQHDETKALQMFLGSSYAETKEMLQKIQRSGDDRGVLLKSINRKDEEILGKVDKIVQSLVDREKIEMTSLSDNGKDQPEDGDIEQDTGERQPDDLAEDESKSIDSEDILEKKRDSEVTWEIHYKHREGLFGKTENRQEDMRALTAQWREERIQYPNWFILPAKLRDKVKMYNQCEELLQCEDLLPLSEQLEFAYELLWRYETAMLSYSVFLQHHAYRIWRSVMKENDWSEKEKNMKWFQIGLFLLREYREDLKDRQWKEVYCELKQHIDFMDFGEQYLVMEEIALSFTSMNISRTVMLLNSYHPSESCFDIRLRLCGIKAECGLLEAARQDVEMLGQDIRTQIIFGKLSGQGDRVYLKSILPCTLHLKSFILRALYPLDQKMRKEVQACDQERLEWSAFYSYEDDRDACDHAVFSWMERKQELPLFELNRETVSIISSDQSCGMAYSFYRVLEKSGLPLSLGHVSLLGQHRESMVESIIEIHLQVGWQLLLRAAGKKEVEKTIKRSTLWSWSREQKDQLFDYAYHALDSNVDMIKEYNPWYAGNVYTSIARNALEILKRLSSVATLPQQNQLIHLMIKLINKNAIKEFRALDSFIAKIMENASEHSKASFVNYLLLCSGDERHHIESEEQLDPFEAFTSKEHAKDLYSKAYVDPLIIDKLFQLAKNSDTERRAMMARMGKLYNWDKLSVDQQYEFGELLWGHIQESTGLPDLPNYYVCTFLQWPHPQNIDAKSAIKRYFFSADQQRGLFKSANTKTYGEISYLQQLCALNENVSGFWSKDDVGQIISLLLGFWNAERKKADSENFKFAFEKRIFYDNNRLLIRTIASFSRDEIQLLDPESRKQLKEALEAMRVYGIQTFEADVHFLKETGNESFLETLVDALYEADAYVTVSASLAIQKYLTEFSDEGEQVWLLQELLKVIRARKTPGMISFLIVVHNIFYMHQKELPESVLKAVEKALLCVEKQTSYSAVDDETKLKSNIEIRCQCAALAFQLYLYEERWMNSQHSDAVLLWRDICCGTNAGNEFVEVRNA